MACPADLETIRRAIRDARIYEEFIGLVPYPETLEEAWGIGDRRDVLIDATFAYSLIALRRLHEFLSGGTRPDDLSAEETGINVATVLGSASGLLSEEEKSFIDKQCAHLTSQGLIDIGEFESGWVTWPEEKQQILKRLECEIERLESGEAKQC